MFIETKACSCRARVRARADSSGCDRLLALLILGNSKSNHLGAQAGGQYESWDTAPECEHVLIRLAVIRVSSFLILGNSESNHLGAQGSFKAGGRSDSWAAAPECEHVLIRLAVIDYLREWRLIEMGEHVQKTLQRDIFARERELLNHVFYLSIFIYIYLAS